jgi:RND superfamily putative drug exporter
MVVKTRGNAQSLLAEVSAAARRAAAQLPTGEVVGSRVVNENLVIAQITSSLDSASAKRRTAAMRDAIGAIVGAETYLTGLAATEYDLDPIIKDDLRKGELFIALPIAAALLILTFRTLSFLLPIVFALFTIATTLGLIWICANVMELTAYIANIVSLIGLGIAIDYSLLIVHRFREELPGCESRSDAIVRTMETAGRAVVISGTAVAIGLGLLALLPLPFLRGFGVGGLLIPAVSVVGAVTLLPVLLSLFGRTLDRINLVDWMRRDSHIASTHGFWPALARWIMHRSVAVAVGSGLLLLILSLPLYDVQIGPGSNYGLPKTLESVRGREVIAEALGAGAMAPSIIVIDTGSPGGAGDPEVRAALGQLMRGLAADPQVAGFYFTIDDSDYIDPSGQFLNLQVFGKADFGTPESLALVDRLRAQLIPAALFPAPTAVLVGGTAAAGRDFLIILERWIPWLALGTLAATYILLLRAFRSLILPLKAIVLNVLSISAASGLTVAVFKWGWGVPFGLSMTEQIGAWIPVMVFTMVFGLSMDYEVFLVSRMREEWDNGASNEHAVIVGLTKTGRLVTSAGLIMVAAFMGFVGGTIVGLQQFGFALAMSILIDITVVRALLLPATMKLFGHWNWWLPDGVAKVLHVAPSPLRE